jgi:hypothetical protein
MGKRRVAGGCGYFGLRYFGFKQQLRLLKRWSRQYFVSSANQ